jgi:hypothetical protein
LHHWEIGAASSPGKGSGEDNHYSGDQQQTNAYPAEIELIKQRLRETERISIGEQP